MIVCICNHVSDSKIKALIKKHSAASITDLQKHISICNNCRGCTVYIEKLLKEQNELLSRR